MTNEKEDFSKEFVCVCGRPSLSLHKVGCPLSSWNKKPKSLSEGYPPLRPSPQEQTLGPEWDRSRPPVHRAWGRY